MRRPLLVIALFAAVPAAATAQTNSLFRDGGIGQNGLSSSTAVGGGRTSSFSANAFGSSLSGGLTQGGSAAGGLGGAGATDALGTQQDVGLGELGQTIGTGPFIGRSDNLGNFVGNQFAGQGGSQLRGFQGLQGLQRGGGNNANNRFGNQGAEPRLTIRPTQRIAFEFDPATPTMASRRISERFDSLANRRPQLAGVTVTADDGGRIVLRGTVETEEARELAAALVRLEPGVREIVNELSVAREPAP